MPDDDVDDKHDAVIDALFASDLAKDVRSEFNARREEGLSVNDATARWSRTFATCSNAPEEGPVVIIAIAVLQQLERAPSETFGTPRLTSCVKDKASRHAAARTRRFAAIVNSCETNSSNCSSRQQACPTSSKDKESATTLFRRRILSTPAARLPPPQSDDPIRNSRHAREFHRDIQIDSVYTRRRAGAGYHLVVRTAFTMRFVMTAAWLLSWWNLMFIVPFFLALVYLGVYTLSGWSFGDDFRRRSRPWRRSRSRGRPRRGRGSRHRS